MIETAIARYISALAGLGIVVEPPDEAPSPEVLAELSRIHDAPLPPEFIAVHRSFSPSKHYFTYWGTLKPLPSGPSEALELGSWIAGSPVPPRQHIPTFAHDQDIYSVALDEQHYGEVWRFSVEADVAETVRVCANLEELFTQWAQLIEEGMLTLNDGFLAIPEESEDQVLANWPRVNILTCALPCPEPLLTEQQALCGMDPDEYRENVLDIQADAMDDLDRVVAELS